jgi:hypothetical protein
MAVGSGTNFFLQYQGKNDIELQKQYGQFVNQVWLLTTHNGATL